MDHAMAISFPKKFLDDICEFLNLSSKFKLLGLNLKPKVALVKYSFSRLIGFGDLMSQKPGPIKPDIDKRNAKNVNEVLF